MKLLPLFVTALLALGSLSCAKKSAQQAHPRPVPPVASSGLARPLHNQGVNMPPASLPPGTRLSYSSLPVPGPFIAMTFDDGPAIPNTPRLLDMLASRGIKATFFTVGRNAARNPNIIRRIVADGHELANHTWTHPLLAKLSDAAVRSELRRSHDSLVSMTGIAPQMYRPPYGSITARQKQWIMSEFGYPTILWSVDPQDWRTRNAAMTRSRILNETRPGSIILVHDIHVSSIDAMPSTLDGLLARGFRFVTVGQLIAISKGGAPGAGMAAAAPGPSFTPGSF